MSPAQRRKRLAKFSQKKKKNNISLKIISILFVVILGLFLLICFNTKYFNHNSKFSLVVNGKDGNISVIIFDPILKEINNIIIPGNTQLNCSRQLGSWKAKSIWKLGTNENLGGNLLRETILKTFHFPVIGWADWQAQGFSKGGLFPLIKSLFSLYKTNLGIGDRVRLGFFSLGVKNIKRNEIDLSKTNILKKVRLIDGEEGYLVTEDITEAIIVRFSDQGVSDNNLRVKIIDASGKNYLAEEVGKTIETIGAKVAFISNETPQDFDCIVNSKEKFLAKNIAKIFSCEFSSSDFEGNFNFQIKIGKEFALRY